MRRNLTSLLLALVVLIPGILGPAWSPAAAAVICQKIDVRTGQCLIGVDAPGTTGQPALSGPSSDSAGAGCFSDWTEQTVPCASGEGAWSNSRDCYVQPLEPQPPLTSPDWQGHTDGVIYTCIPDQTRAGSNLTYFFWSGTAPAGPDPAQVAQEAMAAMGLRAIDIGIVPEPGPTAVGLVGMPTWLWVNAPSEQTWGPITRAASAGGITVTATASVDNVEWDLGDGTRVTCDGPGTPYDDRYGNQTSPDCGHRYTRSSVGQPADAYTVTATSHWIIDWAGGGASGQLKTEFTAQTQIRVGEMQVLITG